MLALVALPGDHCTVVGPRHGPRQREAEDDIRIAEGLLPLTRTRCRRRRLSLILPEMLLVGCEIDLRRIRIVLLAHDDMHRHTRKLHILHL